MADQLQKLVARGVGLVEAPKHGGGDHAGVLLFHAAHHHAQVPRLDDHADALGFEVVHQRAGDLVGQALLQLQTARVKIRQTRQLADAQDAALGDIADMAPAEKRQQVVLAEAEDLDILDDDHVVGR